MRNRALEGRAVLITGGSRGIGAATAVEVAAQGAQVALLARDAEALREVAARVEAAGSRAVCLQCDVTERDQVHRSVEKAIRSLDGLHGVVNNAGINFPMRPFIDMSPQEFRLPIEVNFFGAVEVTRAALPHLLDQSEGSIVNMSSMAGKMGVPTWSGYCSSKHALLGFTKAIAREVALSGITCNAVCPGFVDTGMVSKEQLELWAEEMGTTRRQLIKEVVLKQTPQMRYVEAESVAALTAYLLSDAARDITGQAMNVSCGVGDY